MLKALRLQDFKSFKDQRVEFGPVTLLVGANASGKSNLLDALRFLKGAALGMPLEDVLEDPLRSRQLGKMWPGIRGGAKEVGFRGAQRFTLTSEWEIDGERFEYSITCDVSGIPRVGTERLICTTRAEPEEMLAGQTMGDYTVRFGRAGQEIGYLGHVTDPWRAAIATHLDEDPHPGFTRQREQWNLHRQRLASFRRALSGLAIHEGQPALMRGYVPIREGELGVHAENLSAVLYRWLADPDAKASLLEWIHELCGEEVGDISFSRTDLDDVMLALEDVHGVRTSARSLSDGTLRFLGLLVALREPDPRARRVLLLEEPEVGLHPSRLVLLAEQLVNRTAGGHQTIATTHSPGLLAALPADTLGDVLVCAVSPQSDGSAARRLRDLPSFTEVVARRGIEHLFTTRWLERAL